MTTTCTVSVLCGILRVWQTLVSKAEWSKPVTSRKKPLTAFVASDKNLLSREKWNLGNFYPHLDVVASHYFLMRWVVISTNVIFWYCVMKCVNIWKVCITQGIIFFFKWPVLRIHTSVKDPFSVQERPLDFNVMEYKKYIVTVSNSTWQRTFKKLPLAKFGYSFKVE